jgi:transcriptional regulator GlxA family with amidase domain
MRFAIAAELLATTALSVKQVMVSVGLNDESHFVRNFQALFGIAPMRYRANAAVRNGNESMLSQLWPTIDNSGQ